MESTATDLAPEISGPPPRGEIHKAMAAIMAEVGGVAKGRTNQQQGYKFRGIADLYLACQPVMAKHGVHVAAHRVLTDEFKECTTAKGGVIYRVRQRIEWRFYHADGSYVAMETTGEAMDTGDKASNKCMSAAMKYALTLGFAIPEEDPEQDTEHATLPEMAPTKPAQPPVAAEKPKTEEAPPAAAKKPSRTSILWATWQQTVGAAISGGKEEKAAAYYQWASGMLGREVRSKEQMSHDEVESLILAAQAGEVPEAA